MKDLDPVDMHRVQAAEGWLGLGLRAEAEKELDAIPPEHQRHPDVLEARWLFHAHAQQWAPALATARDLIFAAPDRASGWLHQAYALRRATDDGLALAWVVLIPAAARFPKEPIIPFNLACYACQLGQLDEARGWMKRAMKTGGKEAIKRMALVDEDLKPLWPELAGL